VPVQQCGCRYLHCMQEPKFIRDARRAIEQEAEGRPDAATYVEAGNAALNIVLAHYLATPVLNLAQGRREVDKLRLSVAKLEKTAVTETDAETGLPLAEALRRARDQARTALHAQQVAEAAVKSGSPPIGKRVANARHERTLAENLRLATRVRELEALLGSQ
jgi:hypothetical protein